MTELRITQPTKWMTSPKSFTAQACCLLVNSKRANTGFGKVHLDSSLPCGLGVAKNAGSQATPDPRPRTPASSQGAGGSYRSTVWEPAGNQCSGPNTQKEHFQLSIPAWLPSPVLHLPGDLSCRHMVWSANWKPAKTGTGPSPSNPLALGFPRSAVPASPFFCSCVTNIGSMTARSLVRSECAINICWLVKRLSIWQIINTPIFSMVGGRTWEQLVVRTLVSPSTF